jgi:DNA repair exonuclease SbcCD nuclease subunit
VTRILGFADLHLKYGSPYDREPGDRLADQVKVGQRIVGIAREFDCGLMVNAGDTFEGPTVQPEEYEAYTCSIGQWEGDIVSILGNGRHDAAKRGVTAAEVLEHAATIVRPQVVMTGDIVDDSNVAIACLPWCPVDRLVAARGGGERADVNREAAALLIDAARELREECTARFPDLPAILLGHWSVEGGVTATGAETISFAEPILPLADLEALEFAAVFMGHVHKPQNLSNVSPFRSMPIIVPGSPMPLSFGEHGEHGVWIFDTETGAAEFVPIESRMFSEIEYDAGDWPHIEFAEAMCMDAIVKLTYTATAEQARKIDRRKLRDALYEAGAWKVFSIDAIVARETRARVEGVDETLDEMAALNLYFDAQKIPGPTATQMRARTQRYLEDLGA